MPQIHFRPSFFSQFLLVSCPNKRKDVTLSAKSATSIKVLSYIVRFVVGLFLGSYLALLLFTASPWAQQWTARRLQQYLSEELDTRVEVGHVQLGLFNRVIVDDLLLFDQAEDTLLHATRLSAKVELASLFTDNIHILNAQLFGYDLRLKRATPDQPYNFQFVLDSLASQDTTSNPVGVNIESVIIRRGRLTHDVLSAPQAPHFNPQHLCLEDLAMRLEVDVLPSDSICLNIKELRFRDSRSGLTLQNLSTLLELHLPSDADLSARLTDFHLQLPSSVVTIPHLETKITRFIDADSTSLHLQAFQTEVQGQVTPSDLSPLLPQLATFDETVDFNAEAIFRQDEWHIPHLHVAANDLALTGTALMGAGIDADVDECRIGASWVEKGLQLMTQTADLSPELAETLQRLGSVEAQGKVAYHQDKSSADVTLNTVLGAASLKGDILHSDAFNLTLHTDDFLLANLLSSDATFPLNHFTLQATAEGSVIQKKVHALVSTDDFIFQGEHIGHAQTDFTLSPQALEASLQLFHPACSGLLTASVQSPQDMNLTLNTLEQLAGQLEVSDLRVRQRGHELDVKNLRVSVDNDAEGHHIDLKGDFIDAQLDGTFYYSSLPAACQQILHGALPSLIPAPAHAATTPEQMDFNIHLWDADSLLSLAGLDLRLPAPVLLQGRLDSQQKTLNLNADAAHVQFGNENLHSVSCIARQQGDFLRTFVVLNRWVEDGPIEMTMNVEAEKDQLETFITWDNHDRPSLRGQLSANARFRLDERQHLGADVHLNPSQLIIADTTWSVQGADLQLRDERLAVQGFKVSQMGRHLQVDGIVSSDAADTLYADLRGINLEYVFGLLDFHDVELAGSATGTITATNLMAAPKVDAKLDISNFHFENAPLGQLAVTGGWGRVAPGSIDLDAYIQEPLRHQLSHVSGTITPGHGPGSGLDLDVQARHLNAGFISDYTRSIFQDFIGRATGHARIHGPFRELDLEGALVLDTLALSVGVLGTRYHSLGGDSVWLSTDGVRLHDFQVYDRHHGTDNRQHRAQVNGALTWQHFSNIRYAFDIQAQDFLGYDFRDFGDEVFYGTAFASGNCRLTGDADQLTVDLNGSPSAGTVFTYNASSPETLTDNQFITFKKAGTPAAIPDKEQNLTAESAPAPDETTAEDDGLDIRINFDLQVTPEAQMRLLMDPRSEDYITLYGNGSIRADYYNKGRFQMYGTYHVDRGTYRLSLQDVIRKDFQFQQGGTIVFGGTPMLAGLNLQAIHTVPSVSLNNLAAGSNFAASNVRVNCLMNIGGQAQQPQITFDFDIPNVNEDQKQMVRALISTEEERNLQVIYLLGIGRFYTYELDANEDQTNTAMKSLLSSTLSGQLNDMLSSAIGNSNWNFGTNLSTGQVGWSDMDVEGMLSGRLLNNRLLINGTFGYRDTPVANTNFIGDFDVQWLLTPAGNVRLKAYSETNDRYFTKTALTTQGIGILVRKDFNSFRELFRRKP